MKTKIVLAGILGMALLAMAAPHVWTFKQGGTIEGDYLTSGTTTVVVKRDGTNCLIKISDLATNELTYLAEKQFAQRQARLDAEAKQLAQAGMVEFTVKKIDNFPERLVNQRGWIDCEFSEINSVLVDSKEDTLGLRIRDKNGDTSMEFMAIKKNPYTGAQEPIIAQIEQLKTGDSIRLFVVGMPDIKHDDMTKLSGVYISRLEMIESAAEKKSREKAAEQATEQTLPALDPHTGLPLIQK